MVGLDQLEGEGDAAAAHGLANDADAHLAGFGEGPDDCHLDAVETEAPGDVAGVRAAPAAPGLAHGGIAPFVLLLAARPQDLRLHLDAAGTDDVDLGGALGLAGVRVVAYQRPAAVAQHPQAAADLGISAGVGREEVGGQPVPLGGFIGASTKAEALDAFAEPSA